MSSLIHGLGPALELKIEEVQARLSEIQSLAIEVGAVGRLRATQQVRPSQLYCPARASARLIAGPY